MEYGPKYCPIGGIYVRFAAEIVKGFEVIEGGLYCKLPLNQVKVPFNDGVID